MKPRRKTSVDKNQFLVYIFFEPLLVIATSACDMPEAVIIANIVISCIIGITGTVGNILVIFAFFKFRFLRTFTNIFVLHLAINDLTKASIVITVKSINQASNVTSKSAAICQLSGILRTIGTCQSSLLLGAIALVRYFKVVKPRYFDKVYTLKKTLMYCGCIFAVTLLISLLPPFGIGKYKFSSSHGICFVNWDHINLAFRCLYYVFNVV